MFSNSTIQQGSDCIFATRDDAAKGVSAALLLFAYGSEPAEDTVCKDGLAIALNGTAGILTDAIDQIIGSGAAGKLTAAKALIDGAMKAANRRVWELRLRLGQGICVGGFLLYSMGLEYEAIAWGGGAAYCLDAGGLRRISHCSDLVCDALGNSEFWQGNYFGGAFPLYGSIMGASCQPDPACAAELISAMRPGVTDGRLTEIMYAALTQDPAPPAVIEIHK